MADGPAIRGVTSANANRVDDEPADAELVAALVELGVPPETAEEHARRGDPEGAVFDSVLLPARLERTMTPTDVASLGGLDVEEIVALMEAFGLTRPAPDEPAFTPAEAQVFVELSRLTDVWPRDVRTQVARAYGEMLAGVARAELQAFQSHAQPRLREHAGDAAAQLRAIHSAFERLLPLADPLLVGVHRRWVEHELAQAAVSDAELRAGENRLPGAVEVAFLFCDLKDFTAYSETNGDRAAIAAIEQFFDVVARERGDGGEIVKSLGDGAMLAYGDPIEAVAAGARVIVAMRATELPGVHASAHRGVAIARSGDYFGSAVNLAARLLALSERDELVATTTVVDACSQPFRWQSIGEHAVRGVASPVAVHRLVLPA